jgi:2-methylcitrate dehydratase PrpD
VYPVCGLEQRPIDLALTLIKQHRIQSKEIAKIVERMPEDELAYPGTNYTGPFTSRFQATMSAQFCIAAAFSGKPVMSYSFYDQGYDDPEVSELVKKTELIGEKGRDKIRVEVMLHDGKQYSIEGGGDEILTPDVDRTRVKFEGLAYDFLGKKKGDRVIDMILNLDKLKTIKELTRHLSR